MTRRVHEDQEAEEASCEGAAGALDPRREASAQARAWIQLRAVVALPELEGSVVNRSIPRKNPPKFATHEDAKKAKWFSRRHETSEANLHARAKHEARKEEKIARGHLKSPPGTEPNHRRTA